MKSCNKDVNSGKLTRLGVFSLLALMILTVSTGALADVSDLKVYKRVEGKQVLLERLKDSEKIKTATEALHKETSKENFEKFVKESNGQHFSFVEGLLSASKEAIKANKFADFRTSLLAHTEALKGAEIWGKNSKSEEQEAAFKKLITKLFGKSDILKDDLDKLVKKLTDITDEALLKELFTDKELELLKLFALEETKTEESQDKDELKKSIADLKKLMEQKEEERKKEAEATAKALREEIAKVAATKGEEEVLSPPPAKTKTGELGAWEEMAKQVCAEIKRGNDSFDAEVKKRENELKAILADLEGTRRRPEFAKNQNNNGTLEDILPGLLQNFGNKKNDNFQFPQTPATPPAVASNRPNKGNGGIFDAPVPEKNQPEEDDEPVQYQPSQSVNSPIETSADVRDFLGKSEEQEAASVLREVDENNRTSLIKGISDTMSSRRIGERLATGQLQQRRAAVAASNARQAAEEAKAEYQAGFKDPEGKIGGNLLEEKETLKASIDQMRKNIDDQKQQGNRPGLNKAGRAAFASTVDGLTRELREKEGRMASIDTAIGRVKKQNKAKLETLAQTVKSLEQKAGKLETAAGAIKSEVELVQDIYEERRAQERAMAMGPQVPGGRQNTLNTVASGVQPRAGVPFRPGTAAGLQGGNARGEFRKPLGANR